MSFAGIGLSCRAEQSNVESDAVRSPISASTFRRYVRELRAFNEHAVRSGGLPHSGVDLAIAHLNGRVGRELRASVDLAYLRETGAFFTGERLAGRAVSLVPSGELAGRVVDPACGCGDLLLAAAWQLPIAAGLEETLTSWGEVLHGADLEVEFVEVARQRLTLLALLRGARPRGGALNFAAFLPGIVQADGRTFKALKEASCVLLNPPYGQVVAPKGCPYALGRTTAAALWTADVLKSVPAGCELVAVVPDVLRSGSRYGAWRATIAAYAETLTISTHGQFDALTDVDVFLLQVRRASRTSGVARWPTGEPVSGTLQDVCAVWVGPVVDRRDPHSGPLVPYLTTRELPPTGEHRVERLRHFAKRLFPPPFVVLRRTSRPSGQQARLKPVVIRSNGPVAVENHLIVLRPRNHTLKACRHLAGVLTEPGVTAWLNDRIRCRHLTVTAVREIPLATLGVPWRGNRAPL